jgi:valyl-tRNA synthetase
MISALQRCESDVQRHFEQYRFDLAAYAVYEFIWNGYCDWYLELSKPVLTDDNASPEAKRGTRRTLVRVLEAVLRLAHPIIPFITEEIWQRVAPLVKDTGTDVKNTDTGANSDHATIMLQPYPEADEDRIDEQAERDIEWLKGIIVAIRNIRGEMNISPAKRIPVLLRGPETDHSRMTENRPFLLALAKLETLEWLGSEEAPLSATQLSGNMEVMVPMAGLIDTAAELERLDKELERLGKDIGRLEGKLGNDSFTAKAPAAVVDKERGKLEEARSSLSRLQDQREKIAAL